MQSLSNSNFIFSQTRRVMLLFVFCTVVQMGWWHHTWKDSNSRWIKATLFLLSNKDCWTKANLTCNTARAETLCWICVTFTEWCFFFWYLCWKSNSERSALSFVYAMPRMSPVLLVISNRARKDRKRVREPAEDTKSVLIDCKILLSKLNYALA